VFSFFQVELKFDFVIWPVETLVKPVSLFSPVQRASLYMYVEAVQVLIKPVRHLGSFLNQVFQLQYHNKNKRH